MQARLSKLRYYNYSKLGYLSYNYLKLKRKIDVKDIKLDDKVLIEIEEDIDIDAID